MRKEPIKGQLEAQFTRQGLRILGIDEVGRGCLAGPVYAACVALDYERLLRLDAKVLHLIRDSKKLSTKQRQSIIPTIHEISLAVGIASASAREIEALGIVPATFKAMARAYESLDRSFDLVLIDGNQRNPMIQLRQEAIVGGDSLCFAIAAASILAKEERDTFMRQAALEYPQYSFQENVGYGTQSHLTALASHGITPLHRRNFAPIARLVERHGPASESRISP